MFRHLRSQLGSPCLPSPWLAFQRNVMVATKHQCCENVYVVKTIQMFVYVYVIFCLAVMFYSVGFKEAFCKLRARSPGKAQQVAARYPLLQCQTSCCQSPMVLSRLDGAFHSETSLETTYCPIQYTVQSVNGLFGLRFIGMPLKSSKDLQICYGRSFSLFLSWQFMCEFLFDSLIFYDVFYHCRDIYI